MIIKSTKLAAVALLFVSLPMAANADPTLDPASGHFYEVVLGDSISWTDANTIAMGMSHNGVDGHLATITSAEENDFLNDLLQTALDESVITKSQVWVGGFQVGGSGEPGEGWTWVNSEGAFPGDNSGPGYANWASNEPNNAGGSESHLTLGRYGPGGGWNDEGAAPNSIGGFIIEHDGGTVDAGTCVAGVGFGSCNPSGVLPTSFPSGIVLPSGPELTHGLVRFAAPGPAGVCPGNFVMLDTRVEVDTNGNFVRVVNMASLTVSDYFDEVPPVGEEVILDEHTYGSPCLAVVAGGANFDLTPALANGGVIENEQIPEDVPNIGQVFGCDDDDLQRRTQFGYTTTIRALMHEETAAAMTKSCNSPSRSGTFRFSNYPINTHEDCGIDINLPGGPQAVVQCFTDLAVAKYDLLEAVLFDSRSSLESGRFSKMTSKLNQARSMTKTGKYDRSNTRLQALLDLIKAAEWDVTSNNLNWPGNLEMRILNLKYRNDQLNEVD